MSGSRGCRWSAGSSPTAPATSGPFGSAGQAELVKAAIEDALPLRRCTMRIGARGGGSACALLELGRCLGPCTGAVGQERYAALVATLEAALDGDPEPVLGPLRRRMAAYAAEQRYEQAAGARDRLEALTRALAEARRAAALAGADEIVLARPHRDGREVTVVRRGQLAAVGLVAAGDQPGVERLLEASLAAGAVRRSPAPAPGRRGQPGHPLAGGRRRQGRAPGRPRPPGQPGDRRRPPAAPLRPRPPPPRLAARRSPRPPRGPPLPPRPGAQPPRERARDPPGASRPGGRGRQGGRGGGGDVGVRPRINFDLKRRLPGGKFTTHTTVVPRVPGW